jgi:competence protein ComEC
MNLSYLRFKRLHISWFICAACLGFLLGDGLAVLPTVGYFSWPVWLVVAALLLFLSFIKRRVLMLILAVLAGILLGLWRGTIERVNLASYTPFINQTVSVWASVAEDPTIVNGSQLRLRLDQVVIDDVSLPGQVWASLLSTNNVVHRSDIVEISGKLKLGFGTFPAMMSYGHLDRVTSQPGRDLAREIRDDFGDKLRLAISEPQSDLGMGILAGQKTALPTDLAESFRIAALTHIVVASGYNLTILIRFARRLLARISRWAALSGASALVFAFACVTGFSPSMTRASMVAAFSLLAWYYGRRFHPIVLLSVVAALSIMIRPSYIWGDAGWYMSFLAFAGVIIVAPLIEDYFWGKKAKTESDTESKSKHTIRQIFIETTSAQIMTMPIIALFLGQFAPYGIIANLLVLPIVPLAMLLSFVAGLTGWLVPAAAEIVGWPAQKLLEYIILVSRKVSELPGADHQVGFGAWQAVAVFGLILIIVLAIWRRTRHNFLDDNPVV